MSKVKDLTGLTFGRLTVIKQVESDKNGRARWLCSCTCGNESIKLGKLLINGHCKSCGCGEYENRVNNCTSHRLSNTRLYNIWCGMKQRCYYSKHKDYHRYGARGITVCDEWRNDFKAFYDWSISHGYRDDLTIDRIDNDKGYSPDNCRWATYKEQGRNLSSNVNVTLNGETKILNDWLEILNIPYHKIAYRTSKGMSLEDALRQGA